MRIYKKILSTALAASMTFSSLPVAAVTELDAQASSVTNEVEEGVILDNEEEKENKEETEDIEESEDEVEEAEENAEVAEQNEETDIQITQSENSDSDIFITDSNGCITGFNNIPENANIVVPYSIEVDEYGYVPVKKLGNGMKLTNANNVSSIDLSACTNLEKINTSAFSGCDNLSSVKFPKKNYTISRSAFMKCKNLTYIDLSYCTAVGNLTFAECSGITGEINLSNCTFIGEYAFAECSNITEIKMDPTKTQDIGVCTFAGCVNLKYFNKNETSGIDFDLTGIRAILPLSFAGCTNAKPVVTTDIPVVCIGAHSVLSKKETP